MKRLAEETADDWWEVEALLDLCFAPGREALAGAIRNWPVRIEGPRGKKWALLLGPVAVHPTHQGEGLGALLILRALEMAREGGWSRVILVGDLPYYRRFGFERLTGVEMPPPTNPERVLGIALREGAWDGVTGRVARALA
jgi:predicted N-acetyltransferase YhbS